jgi:hypothetical protein
MKTRFLFPNQFKRIGWILFVPSLVAGIIIYFLNIQLPFLNTKVFAIYDPGFFSEKTVMGVIENNISDEILGILIIVGALLVACSKEKNEDEYIAKIRLESLLWATYVNYGLLLAAIVFVYGGGFYSVIIFNMFTLLIIFLIRFNYILYKNSRLSAYEK